ncbi:uncharacterized protein MELLADRAFT_87961 [Melampsora larici-populina 98AG31]|uniref:Uncharacterized protein n=1 Tax=Melampsora larici-populina (strain 98AG31 / pathotype 3-4-7) TaxID=747676 RepID=F4RQJ3_MELLP|nr:uncharacterized protein MELLADRAFT_87961 [Melampsora larici-populina 98AG31]EGG05308.1 hypothetical protein MELLADRAFT_87961 [Melampsora larici-populina 98AG31]
MDWNVKMKILINQTKVYSQLSEGDEELIKLRWEALLRESRLRWKAGTESEIVDSAPLDETEVDELNLGLLDLDVNDDADQLYELEDDDFDGDRNMGQVDDGDEGEVD